MHWCCYYFQNGYAYTCRRLQKVLWNSICWSVTSHNNRIKDQIRDVYNDWANKYDEVGWWYLYLSISLFIHSSSYLSHYWVCSHRNKTRFLKEAFTRGLILCEACWNLRKIKISNAFACSSYWVIKAGEGTGHNEHVSNWDIDHSSMVDATNTPFRSASFILSNRSQISSKDREHKDMAHKPAWVKREKKTLGFPWVIKQTTF